jgi:hypothetical protein
MSVLSVVTLKGDRDQVVTHYAAVELEAEQDSRISHTWATIDDGVVVADWWESEDDLHEFVNKLQQQGREDKRGQVEVFEVHTASPPRGALRGEPVENGRPAAMPPATHEQSRAPEQDYEDAFDSVLKLFGG